MKTRIELKKSGDMVANSPIYEHLRKIPPVQYDQFFPSSNSSNSQGECQAVSFLKTFLDFAYYLCISPFRLELNSVGNKIIVKRWWLQRLISVVLILHLVPWLIRDIRILFPADPKDPSPYFGALLHTINAISKVIVLRIMWRKQESIVYTIQCVIEMDKEIRKEGKAISVNLKVVAQLICLSYVACSFYDFLSGRSVLSPPEILAFGWAPSDWWKLMKKEGRYNLLMEGTSSVLNGDWQDSAVGLIAAIGWWYRRVFGAYCDLLLLMSALWSLARQFAVKLNNDIPPFKFQLTVGKTVGIGSDVLEKSRNSWQEIYNEYNWLKGTSNLINSFMSPYTTSFWVASVLDYATTFDRVFGNDIRSGHWTKALGILFFFVEQSLIFYFAADICHQMGTLKSWLAIEKNRRNVSPDQVYFVINELDTHAIAIKGSNVYPITYSLVASMIGLAVTYFTICVQA